MLILNNREAAILAIENKAEEYGLKALSDLNWADNLMRLGVIERPSAPIMSRGCAKGSFYRRWWRFSAV